MVLGVGAVSYEQGNPVNIAIHNTSHSKKAELCLGTAALLLGLQGYLAHKKQRPPRTLQ